MGSRETDMVKKRKIDNIENNGDTAAGKNQENNEEDPEMTFSGSEEMKLGIAHILEKVARFNEMVSELLESGKLLFNKLNQEFEERILMIHKEQIEKWQEDIKELRLIDATNEEMNARLDNAKCLLQNVPVGH